MDSIINGEADPPYLQAFERVQGRLASRLQSGEPRYGILVLGQMWNLSGRFWRYFERRGAMKSDMEVSIRIRSPS